MNPMLRRIAVEMHSRPSQGDQLVLAAVVFLAVWLGLDALNTAIGAGK